MLTFILIIISLFFSALFSGTEIAFVSANKLKIELKKKKGGKRGKILAGFYKNPSAFLSSMLVGNNISLVIFAYMMQIALSPYLESLFPDEILLLLMNTLIITVVVLIFGEFLPKTLFRLNADDILYFLVYPLSWLKFILGVPSRLMTALSNLMIKKIFKMSLDDGDIAFTRLDLENFIDDAGTDEEEEDIDKELFAKALKLREVKARDCMVPRTELHCIDVSKSISELEKLFQKTKVSRLVVIDNDIDNILGYVHHHQLFEETTTLQKLLLPLPFIPEVMRSTDLLNKFIKEALGIVCVVDEFGGVSGIVTLEDILEEIFGEIEDEHDREGLVEKQIAENEYLFSGRHEIDYLNEKYENIDLPLGEYQTISGYVVMTTESIPKQGETVILGDYKFIFEIVSETKIETIRVIKLLEE